MVLSFVAMGGESLPSEFQQTPTSKKNESADEFNPLIFRFVSYKFEFSLLRKLNLKGILSKHIKNRSLLENIIYRFNYF